METKHRSKDYQRGKLMLTTDSDIKQQLLDEWEYLSETNYPEDSLHEWADTTVPFYTNEIIQEWTDLPHGYRDRWTEITDSPESITQLMSLDLYLYYQERYTELYAEILDEKDTDN